jgi:hypothetical protein
MGSINIPGLKYVITGFLFSDDLVFDSAKTRLTTLLGAIDYESSRMDFNYTGYYAEEMGSGLTRVFVSFERLAEPESIYRIKLATNEIERELSVSGKRRINIDPGYLDLSKLVLLSTKDYSHRIHAGQGIYAEVTLSYKDRSFRPWPWTYPDYGTTEYIEVFNLMRDRFKKITSRGD